MAEKARSRARSWTPGLAALLSVMFLVVQTGGAGADGATSTQPFEVAGNVENPAVTAPPNVQGLTGGFTVRDIDDHGNNTAPAQQTDANDGHKYLTIYVTTSTKFYKCDASGNNCAASTQTAVVAAGARVLVSGRYWQSTGSYQLIANYVWSPPPAPQPPPPPTVANPKPTGLQDYNLSLLYGVTGKVVGTKIDLIGGFVMGQFTDYGCGTQSNCRVQQIAQAHNNRLTIDPQPQTAYWKGDGCTYTKTTDTYRIIAIDGTSTGLAVSGHYLYQGTDWAFYASNIYSPAPKPASECPPTQPVVGTLSATANATEQNPDDPGAANDPASQTWYRTSWSGTMGPLGPLANGSLTMTLTWQHINGVWEFYGTYAATGLNNGNKLAGSISGTASAPTALGDWSVNAQVTVDQATGPNFNGYTGSGTWNGSASSLTPNSQLPPWKQSGQFVWHIGPG